MRLEALGHRAIIAPLSVIRPIAWSMPPGDFDALLLSSVRALAAHPALAELVLLPAFVVGPTTATAARAAGFVDVRETGGAQSALDRIVAPCRLLWLSGTDRTGLNPRPGVPITVVETYAADLIALDEPAIGALGAGEVDWVLLYSARAVAHFARALGLAGVARSRVRIAAISPAALAAAPDGWRAAVAATAPNQPALFAAAGL